MSFCRHFDAGRCGSCTLLPVPHPRQISQAESALRALLPPMRWEPPILSAETGFRTRAKLAVSGTAQEPVFSFPGGADDADLADCPLYPALITEVLESCRALIRRAQIPPYSVARRRGELKYVLVTASATEAMVRFVLRTDAALPRLREHLGLRDPRAVAVSANLHPEHAATLEGEEEIHLAGASSLVLPVGDVRLRVLPGSFTQTNPAVAGELYRTVAAWAREIQPARAWDLFSGAGGFALHLAAQGVPVTGVELNEEAVYSARQAAADLAASAGDRSAQPAPVSFAAADAFTFAAEQDPAALPDLVVVNPPRRGLGQRLAQWLNELAPDHIIYSSCNPHTLARDLELMPRYRPVRGRLADMFPHTAHNEVVVQYERVPRGARAEESP